MIADTILIAQADIRADAFPCRNAGTQTYLRTGAQIAFFCVAHTQPRAGVVTAADANMPRPPCEAC